MTDFFSSAWWCLLQTALVASLGAAAMWLLGRRSPGAAAIAGSAAAATILAVTALIPAPMPRLTLGSTSQVEFADASPAVAARSAAQGELRGDVGEEAGGVDVGVFVRRMLHAVGAGSAKPQAAGGIGNWIAGIAAFGAVVGLARFAIALRYVRSLRRASVPIADAELLALFADVGKRLGVRRAVKLRESAAIASAAVLGWRRPVVLLPADRAGWTAEQLQAALAHELAHVVRNDFGWRAAASLAQAIHFFYPLVHWLTRRLALVQELAADEIAAAAAGGPAVYLRALSELAVLLDDQRGHGKTRLRVEPTVLPALSSHLMRRIAMLRSKEGSTAGGGRSKWGVLAAGLIAMAGAGTMALRGVAETMEPTPTENVSATKMFARSPLDVSALFTGNQGLCVVRIHELAQRPAFAPLVQLANSTTSEEWRRAFKGNAVPTVRLETIECVAGAITVKRTSTVDAEGKRRQSSESVSFEEFVIRFVDDVEWRPWIEKYMPGGEEIRDEGLSYVKMPKFQGDVHLLVAERDPRTIVIAGNVERLRELVAGGADAGVSLSKSLASVDGGLAALAIDAVAAGLEARLEGVTFSTDDAAAIAAFKALFLNVRQFSVGFDLDETSNQSELRLSLGCADQASAEQVRAALVTIQPFFKPYLKAVSANSVTPGEDGPPPGMVRTAGEDDTSQQGAAWYLALIENSAVSLEPRGNGMVDVGIESAAPFPSTVLTAYGRPDEADAPNAKRR